MPLIHNLMVGKNQKTRIYNADALKIDEEISDCKKKDKRFALNDHHYCWSKQPNEMRSVFFSFFYIKLEAVKLKPFTLEVNHRKKCDLRIDVTLSVQQSLEMEEQKPLAVQALELSVLPVFFPAFFVKYCE